ncbi:host nuclease inhibitor protein [Bradyrhizobium roseum]|uniref:host nuclease inhibitor protein n=1 Tax=Bradyrhizobium roseum TaxID=3056648 RepID=UPI0026220CFF|nr:host nuclease inhibitor protein [Bradyrhizobium roseus]WKA31576.1 host nuclease inhibitor protein [Bradyrhizobium roseus]
MTQTLRAWCFPSGLIEFGTAVPKGAIVFARGPEKQLREFIDVNARHARVIGGRRGRMPGTVQLLVPGIPEADSQLAALEALCRWVKWIGINPPKGVRVLPR